ncbi:hypothetical protein N7471_003200 [Penicillium samsonianum]|uniref:uncharacterized protein n=1 Tax=Penicillium samsonianum TaxID=1882272 RepID=UPI00254891B9|nr:uncharacterized protein N7471_003200 [Penicillium samsonianum]KAJ6143747.1 hypothetical protein N7471_003200 [Penicillium samsonianum]
MSEDTSIEQATEYIAFKDEQLAVLTKNELEILLQERKEQESRHDQEQKAEYTQLRKELKKQWHGLLLSIH